MAAAAHHKLVTVALVLSTLLLVSVESSFRQQPIATRRISDLSFSCDQLEIELTRKSEGIRPQWTQLSDMEMMQLMRMRGIEFESLYMATSQEDADSRILDPFQFNSNSRSSERTRPILRSEVKAYLTLMRALGRVPYRHSSSESCLSTIVEPEEIGLNRTIYSSDGYVTNLSYCTQRDQCKVSIDGTNYLHMCTHCVSMTQTPQDVWPRKLAGIECSTRDTGCLFYGGGEYGRCIQSERPVSLLRERKKACISVTDGNEERIAQDWEVITRRIGTGCECALSADQELFT